MENTVDVMALVDHHGRKIAVAVLGDREARTAADVHNSETVQLTHTVVVLNIINIHDE